MGEAAPPSRSSLDSRAGVRREKYFDHLQDEKVRHCHYSVALMQVEWSSHQFKGGTEHYEDGRGLRRCTQPPT
jgi:hypothetical protein